MAQADEIEIRQAVADVTLAWAGIESAFGMLLSRIIGRQPTDLAMAILFSAVNLEPKIKLLDDAFKSLLAVLPRADEITPLWDALVSNIKGQKKIRNTVAHGAVVHQGYAGKDHVRITPPMFSPQYEAKKTPKGPQGLSVADLRASLVAVNGLHERLGLFIQLLDCWNSLARDYPNRAFDSGPTSVYGANIRALQAATPK
jgi:hypothetical protein